MITKAKSHANIKTEQAAAAIKPNLDCAKENGGAFAPPSGF